MANYLRCVSPGGRTQRDYGYNQAGIIDIYSNTLARNGIISGECAKTFIASGTSQETDACVVAEDWQITVWPRPAPQCAPDP